MAKIQKTKPEKDLELIQRIGSGTYGEVYKAQLRATGELAAVKIINIEPGDDLEVIQQEICIMQDCKHENIVQYFGSYLRRDKLWIAMEYCGGGSLQDIYNVTGPFTESMIGVICAETLKGLDYMHSLHKIHRDIKGANILLNLTGHVKLADFGVGAQISSTLGKRNSFIGTPYWMAPEVAAVERTGGYNQACDVWAVGITAIELAECQPPLFELHPMRALYLISKRNYSSPVLKDKNLWGNIMKDFIKQALTKNPKKRPTAEKLLQHPFCQDRSSKTPLQELLRKHKGLKGKKKAYYLEQDEDEEEVKAKSIKRIQSKKDKHKVGQHIVQMHGGQLFETPKGEKKDCSQNDKRDDDSTLTSSQNDDNSTLQDTSTVKHVPKATKASERKDAPPLPPRAPTASKRPESQAFAQKSSANCFSKVFNECPLNIVWATSWTHPETKHHHLLFAAIDEGIYSLDLDDLQNVEMIQIFSRPCQWVFVIKNILVSISGRPSNVYMHNLVSLHNQRNIEQFISVPKGIAYTTKIPETTNALKCRVVHNPYNYQMYLYVAMKEVILLLQWYEPLQKFMIVKSFECHLPEPLTMFEALVVKGKDYPQLCVGAYQREDGSILLDNLDLENNMTWRLNRDYKRINVMAFSQLEKDVIMVAFEKKVVFVDIDGQKIVVKNRLTELNFDYSIKSVVCLPGSVLTFNAHGIQGKSLVNSQITAQFHDTSRSYKLLGLDRMDFQFRDDGYPTNTSKEQQQVEASLLDNTNEEIRLKLLRRKHIAYLMKGLVSLSTSYECLDSSRPWLCYWILHSLELLNVEVPVELCQRVALFLDKCQDHETGGFAGGPGQMAHLAPTYAAVCALCILGKHWKDAYDIISRPKLSEFLMARRTDVGSYTMHDDGEEDIRGVYCAVVVAYLTNITTKEMFKSTPDWLKSCQTYEGGFGGCPDVEAHGGYTFCGFAALLLLGEENSFDMKRLLKWVAMRQMKFEGGFQGGVFPLIHCVMRDHGDAQLPENSYLFNHDALKKYVLRHCQCVHGGLIDKPGKSRDYYHTCYCLSGLSVADHFTDTSDPCSLLLQRNHPIFNICMDSAFNASSHFNFDIS